MARRYSLLRRRETNEGKSRRKLQATGRLLPDRLTDFLDAQRELLDELRSKSSVANTPHGELRSKSPVLAKVEESPVWYRRVRVLSQRSLRRGIVLPKVFVLPEGIRRSHKPEEVVHPDVLILSAHFGNGHISAARALEEEFAAQGYSVLNVESLLLTFGPTGSFCKASYEAMVKHWPGLWGAMYRQLDRRGSFYEVVTKMENAMLSPLERFLFEARPKAIISTHPLPLAKIAALRKHFENTLIVSIVTDVHPNIIYSRGTPDIICVPTDTTRRILLYRDGEKREKVHVTGIPINRAFTLNESKTEARQGLNLPESEPVVLVGSGGIGGGPIEQVLDALAELTVPCHVIVVCGRNKLAYERLSAHVRIYGKTVPRGEFQRKSPVFTVKGALSQDEMARHLRACDVFVAKAGGLTFSETTAVGRPLLVYAPLMIPGQEEDNAGLLRDRGAGLLFDEPDQLRQEVERLLRSPEALETMSQRSKDIGRPYAAAHIVRLLQERGITPKGEEP